MEKLVLFQREIDALNDEECDQCITLFLSSCKREIIKDALFKQFCEELANNQMDNIDKMNNIISEILIARFDGHHEAQDIDISTDSDDEEDSVNVEQLKLHQLPSDILSQISCCLPFADKLHLEKCNRSIFIGCRSASIPIYSLDEYKSSKLITFYNKNTAEHLRKLRIFKSLTLSCRELVECNKDTNEYKLKYAWNTLDAFQNIQELEIKFCDLSAVKVILSHLSLCKDLSNIKTLIMNPNDDTDSSFFDILFSFITNKLDLEYFHYYGFADGDYDSNINYQWISKLKGINFREYEWMDNVMRNICSSINVNLESLHQAAAGMLRHETHGKLENLKEICLEYDYDTPLEEIKFLAKQNMKRLKRIHFRQIAEDAFYIDDKSDELYNEFIEAMESWMNKIIKTAEYICFNMECEGYPKSVLDILSKLLRNKKKKTLKIRINDMYFDEFETLKDFVNTLDLYCSDWIIIVYSGCNKSNDILENELKSMREKYNVIYKKQNTRYDEKYTFVINKIGSKINGYHENWIMPCYECQQSALF